MPRSAKVRDNGVRQNRQRHAVMSNYRLFLLGHLEEIETPFEGAQPDKLISVPVLFTEAVVNQLPVQLLHSGSQVILQVEVGEHLVQQIKLDAVITRIGTDLARIGDFCAR